MSKFNILLVDDIKENIYSLKMIIEDSFDVNISSALSAQEGISILMENDIDLILSDIQMPEIDGFEFAEYIKGIEKTKDIPIIFITGIYDKNEYQQKGYSLGAVEYISKPIDDTLLTSKLKVYIDLFESHKNIQEEVHKKDELLIHQSKMATMGEMIGVIAHQLKQPLNIMSLYCSDVKDSHKYNEIDDDFIKKFDDNTKEQIAFMTDTINSFTDFFNPNKTKTIFSLKTAFTKTLHLLNKQMENNNITVHATIGEENAYGVESEFQQIFLNLITNSKDAFIERKIENREITITSLTKDQYSVIIFEDNAGGIKEVDIEKIFDPYFTTKEYGTGTGLYMVKLVIQNSFAGKLKIQNSDKGAKFIIILKAKKS
jgi:two-component system sensor histidine kinase/response regulator